RNLIAELLLEQSPDKRPVIVDDREVNVVSVSAILIKHVFSKDSFFFRAETCNRLARFHVFHIDLQFNAAASQFFKRVPKLQEFCLGVYVRTLKLRSQPCHADLEAPMFGKDMMITRRADGAPALSINCCKHDR